MTPDRHALTAAWLRRIYAAGPEADELADLIAEHAAEAGYPLAEQVVRRKTNENDARRK